MISPRNTLQLKQPSTTSPTPENLQAVATMKNYGTKPEGQIPKKKKVSEKVPVSPKRDEHGYKKRGLIFHDDDTINMGIRIWDIHGIRKYR